MQLYDRDFYAWLQEQVALLKSGQLDQLDIVNLVEEIESLGRQERRELVNRLGILLGHLLKWQFQPRRRSKSWTATIVGQRQDVQELIDDNPSLKPYLIEAMENAYQKGVLLVLKETPLSQNDLPSQCPYTFEQVMDADFYPG
ncbi:DUF29 domain-containing protein [Candidatus Synechococcus calcipolaris G9]|uniref:DUF29 domain-containing protein n=1 Tax=Candidatus Synechococcus calcipolaris G9 TaxID=1497997 RepID=A0ABT6EXJ1_9SYNE|nr:DUF29 domain-containing protein [Candidatus Synechococcus calcipolaris]MDG2990520.1 DUF29 domain-containing protein [Candidatus Synechococcus calcipolaris G9]